jgi:hypothetical protein
MTARPDDERPPLGSWSLVYGLVCVVAVAIMALLYWGTVSLNLPVIR